MRFTFLFIFLLTNSVVIAQGLTPFLDGSLYGYADSPGSLVIAPQYDNADFFDETNSYAIVKQNGKWFVIDNKGKPLKDIRFDCKPTIEFLKKHPKDISNAYKSAYKNREKFDSTNVVKNLRLIKKGVNCRANTVIVFNIENFRYEYICPPNDFRYGNSDSEPFSVFESKNLIAVKVDTNFQSKNAYSSKYSYLIYDNELNEICSTNRRPIVLNEKLIHYTKDNQGYLYDTEKRKAKKTPFRYILEVIDSQYYSVSNYPKGYYASKNRFGLSDFEFNLLIDTIYSHQLEWDGDKHLNTYINGKRYILNFQGNQIFEPVNRIHKQKDINLYIIKDTLNKISLYTSDLKKTKFQNYDTFTYNNYKKQFHFRKGDITGTLDKNLNLVVEESTTIENKSKSQSKPKVSIFRKSKKEGKQQHKHYVSIKQIDKDTRHTYMSDNTPITDAENILVHINFHNDFNGLLAFEFDGNEGIVNYNNEIILPASNQEIYAIDNQYVIISKDKKYFIYDTKMTSLFPYGFDYVYDNSRNNRLRLVGKKIPGSEYEFISESCLTNEIDTVISFRNTYGYLDANGNFALSPIYSSASSFKKGKARVAKKDKNGLLRTSIIDTTGLELIAYEPGISLSWSWQPNDTIHEASKNNLKGIIDNRSSEIIPLKYKSAQKFYEDKFYLVIDEFGERQLLNSDGNIIFTDLIFDHIIYDWRTLGYVIPLINDKYLLRSNDTFYIIDFKGNKYADFKGQSVRPFEINGRNMIEVEDEGLTYYVDLSNYVVYRE